MMGNNIGDIGIIQLLGVSKDVWRVKYYASNLIALKLVSTCTVNKVSKVTSKD